MTTATFLNVNRTSGNPVCLNLSLLLFIYMIENTRPSTAVQQTYLMWCLFHARLRLLWGMWLMWLLMWLMWLLNIR